MTVRAVALRNFTLGDDDVSKGKPLSLPANQFHDLESVGLVGRAPPEKVPATPKVAKRAPGKAKTAK